MELLIALIVVLVIALICIWIVDQIPGDPKIKTIVKVLIALCVLIWLLAKLGVSL